MKTEINKLHGGPAFPITMATEVVAELKRTGQEEVILSLIGITKRDYFAAAALPELIRSALDLDHVKWDATAEHAYIIADEILIAPFLLQKLRHRHGINVFHCKILWRVAALQSLTPHSFH